MAETNGEARTKRIEVLKSALFRWAVYLQLLGMVIFLYVKFGGMLITQTNYTPKDIHGGDQSHNMRLATQTAPDLSPDYSKGFTRALSDFFPHRTDGVVQPLWPWVSAWMVKPGHTITEEAMVAKRVTEPDYTLFNRGRWFNVFFTATFLTCLGIAAARIFSIPAALNIVLLGGFGALLPRAVYFQPEPLYFVFYFVTWVACVSALKHNTLWIYGLIGVLSGVAYLTKASITPMLLVFVGVSTLRCFWEMLSARRRGFTLNDTNLWHWRNHLVGVVMLAMMHLLTAGPRLSYSQEHFGSMTHSFPSYWMWMDKFDPDCIRWMDEHNTRDELEAMLPADKPSLGKYLQTHTREEFVTRLKDGTWNRVTEFLWPKQTKRSNKVENQKPWRGVLEWRGIYLAWLVLMLGGLLVALQRATPRPEHAGHVVFRHGTVTTLLFVVGCFLIYAFAYGWYAPIARGSGDRFMLSMYLPLVFSIIWGAESIVKRIRRRQGNPWIGRVYLGAQWLLFLAIAWRFVEILRSPQFSNL
ncbi:hypothetical protein [Roseimicrobium sp. ORNL1]|uniref:hypothetical protein n=1 Tax=Roseimicrobium sp. ORNL1 TaxID=2711231 RepID=UPI0013E16AD6|nr:hypothetical protein [Roseimicrobium sp. ORNL1]QIF04680.1 hypothetical protein G5S37_25170 [Roseimicrobium sp. ORNL1]